MIALDRPSQRERDIAFEQTAAWLELAASAQEVPYAEEAYKRLVDSLRAHLGCAGVALGYRRGKRCRVLAASSAGAFDKQGQSIGLLEREMEAKGNRGISIPRD